MPMSAPNPDQTQSQLETLYACVAACERCATACLHEADVPLMTRCINLCRDCADVCALAARLVARGSAYAEALLTQCEAICRACADECGQHSHRHCQECAEACRRCA